MPYFFARTFVRPSVADRTQFYFSLLPHGKPCPLQIKMSGSKTGIFIFCGKLGILFIIFLCLILSSCKKAPDVAERVKRPRKKVVAKEIKLKPIEEEKFLYASHDKRDPFVPLVDKKGRPVSVVEGGLQLNPSDLYLEGIIWDPIKPMAIINDEIVSSGDKIRGVTIVKVEKDKVILSYKNESFELKMD